MEHWEKELSLSDIMRQGWLFSHLGCSSPSREVAEKAWEVSEKVHRDDGCVLAVVRRKASSVQPAQGPD